MMACRASPSCPGMAQIATTLTKSSWVSQFFLWSNALVSLVTLVSRLGCDWLMQSFGADRVFGILRENNPELTGEKRRTIMKPPQVLHQTCLYDKTNEMDAPVRITSVSGAGLVILLLQQVAREGTKKTVFTNFLELCKAMNRQLEHVQAFLLAELGTSGNLDGQSRLVVKGRFLPKAFEGVLRRYVNE